MQPEQMIAALLVLAALFSYCNERFLRIPPTIGMLVVSLLVAGGVLLFESWGWESGRDQILASLA